VILQKIKNNVQPQILFSPQESII